MIFGQNVPMKLNFAFLTSRIKKLRRNSKFGTGVCKRGFANSNKKQLSSFKYLGRAEFGYSLKIVENIEKKSKFKLEKSFKVVELHCTLA